MATSLNLLGQASANQRVIVSASRSTALAQDAVQSNVTISLRRPHLGERFGRAVANFFTLGWYTRNQNREQWAQFQKLAVAGQLQGASQSGLLAENGGGESHDLSARVRQAMAAYDGKRLTQARAANVLAELQRIREGDPTREKLPAMLDAKTNALARGWRSMKQLMRGLNETETGLRGYAQVLKARRAPHDPSWKTEDSMLSILRPGRQISSHAIDEGQKALGATTPATRAWSSRATASPMRSVATCRVWPTAQSGRRLKTQRRAGPCWPCPCGWNNPL